MQNPLKNSIKSGPGALQRVRKERPQTVRTLSATHVDYNGDGEPVRFQQFENNQLMKQVCKTPDGVLSSEEFYDFSGAAPGRIDPFAAAES